MQGVFSNLYIISVETHFKASHQLLLACGTKESEHSHDWKVSAQVCSSKLSEGICMDFNKLKAELDYIVSEFDNISLNNTEAFNEHNPSAEMIAKYIYEQLEPSLPKGIKLNHVEVAEQSCYRAKYMPDSIIEPEK